MLDIQARVFSRIKNTFPKNLKTKYPNISFTTSDRVADNPQFPTVYIHEMSSQELGRDLSGTTINAIRSTFQIEVYDNNSMDNVQTVMSSVIAIMKKMRYEVTSMPEFKNSTETYRSVTRFRRVIGSGETL